jgi:SAM-dependent methyltransferase
MSEAATPETRRSYDRVASRYLERFEHELDDKPFDRAFLDAFAAGTSGRGWIVDLGCGPGHIGKYLQARGLRVVGLDLSFEMLKRARGILGSRQVQADIRALPFTDTSIEGVVALYSLIHIPSDQLEASIHEVKRVLVDGGYLAVTSHVAPLGDSATAKPAGGTHLHVDELLSEPVALDFYFYGADELARVLRSAGFSILRREERDPYPPVVEAQTRRAYVWARKPSSA